MFKKIMSRLGYISKADAEKEAAKLYAKMFAKMYSEREEEAPQQKIYLLLSLGLKYGFRFIDILPGENRDDRIKGIVMDLFSCEGIPYVDVDEVALQIGSNIPFFYNDAR